MAQRFKLSDVQLILLTTASQRSDGSLLPPPASIAGHGLRIRKSVASLLSRGFAEEYVVETNDQVWSEEDGRRIGVRITDGGRAAIGVEPAATPDPAASMAAVAGPSLPRTGTKQALVIELLKREEGASLGELARATGWLPHTTRAALTGLRKKGHAIASGKLDSETRYRLTAAR